MTAELGDPARAARSLTCHYLRPPGAGELRIDVTVERSGRSLSTVSARLSQGGALCVIAVGAFAVDFRGALDYAGEPPAMPAPAEVERLAPVADRPPITEHFEMRPTIGGAALRGADESTSGGWLRFADAAAARRTRPGDVRRRLVAVADAAPHAPGRGADDRPHRALPRAGGRRRARSPRSRCWRSSARSTAADGFFEEDGELWSADGVLLAHSRQLALLVDGGR